MSTPPIRSSRDTPETGDPRRQRAPPAASSSSEKFACPVSGFTITEIEPRLFRFNAPQGACPACDGLGEKLIFDEDLVVPNHALSIKKGAVVPWAKSNPPSPYYMQVLGSLGARITTSRSTRRGSDLPDEVQRHHPPRHRGQARHADLHRRHARSTTSRSRSRASSATSTAACSRPRARGCARSWPSTSPRSRARSATARASSPRRSRSRSRCKDISHADAPVGGRRARLLHRHAAATSATSRTRSPSAS